MNFLFKIVVPVLALVFVSGCSFVREVNAGRYNENTKTGLAWLSDQFDPAGMNVGGHWTSVDWGEGNLSQSGRNVSGKLGDYDVRGVVSGNHAYLLISEGGWNYYCAVLENPAPGLLTGHFSRSIPFVKNLARPMRLEQLAH